MECMLLTKVLVITGRTFRVKTYLLNEDSLKSVQFTLTPHEAIGTVFLTCDSQFDQNITYTAGHEIICVVDYPINEVKRFVPTIRPVGNGKAGIGWI